MILRTEKLVKQFGGLTAVNQLDMEVREGCINALIGPNGSGKTTTLNMVSGVYPPTAGEIYLDDQPLGKMPEHIRARGGIRRTFQNIKLFYSMTALENVMMGGQGQDTSIIKFIFGYKNARNHEKELADQAEEALAYVGLESLRDRYISALPYGQQKKLEIARALMGKPRLLLLDEPATGLNPTERQELVRIINKICEDNMTVLLIEHNMDVIMTISNWITVLNFGQKIAEGKPGEVQNDDNVIEAYLGSRYKKISGGV